MKQCKNNSKQLIIFLVLCHCKISSPFQRQVFVVVETPDLPDRNSVFYCQENLNLRLHPDETHRSAAARANSPVMQTIRTNSLIEIRQYFRTSLDATLVYMTGNRRIRSVYLNSTRHWTATIYAKVYLCVDVRCLPTEAWRAEICIVNSVYAVLANLLLQVSTSIHAEHIYTL